uniref:WW domain-containing protein n=1 Tax=Helicotheca tamesis TaxID=374047 RepID=A0A7S2MFH0_9STRA|mmetsp:Transcript_15151/g.20654  ORF Transcript_15151/g.20654 Transcript_15151/m.20654 type:complete len:405 (+) Transcript_15151:161-1375(+)|eukprot:CAMPEP_0185733694 /NCGR_PEP_ID=MMETSP1171-20130828/20315_1 /TAXON_ID=374046 /ORGANISM="Helicotheca tamensis, Strain CCMP826" /LENGTH=404 /DNA_ID=CAMNT_0028403481 /DNA_START=131 /DNA_END=1345 /DNA_ORIENTATION=-
MANITETSNAEEDDGPLVWLAFYSEEEGREYYYEPKRRIATWTMPDNYHPVLPTEETTRNGGDGLTEDEENQVMNTSKQIRRMSVSFSSAIDYDDDDDDDDVKDEFSAESVQKSSGLDFGAGEIVEQNTHPRWVSSLSKRFLSVFVIILLGGIVVVVSLRGELLRVYSFLPNNEENATLDAGIPVPPSLPTDVANAQNTVVQDVPQHEIYGSSDRSQSGLKASMKAKKNASGEVAKSNMKPSASKEKTEKVQIAQTQNIPPSAVPNIAPHETEEPIAIHQKMHTKHPCASQEGQDKVNVNNSYSASANLHPPKNSENIPNHTNAWKEDEKHAGNISLNDDKEEHDVSLSSSSSTKTKRKEVAKATKHLKRCLIPFAYLVSSKCRQKAKEHPLFNVQNIVDSLME